MLMLSLVSVSHMIGCVSESDFDTEGGSASSGRRRRMRDTRSRTSFAASSRSRLSSNSTVTCAWPSRLAERIVFTPSMPESSPSSTCVMRVSMTSADAPGYDDCTCTTGGTTSGCSRTVRSRNDSTPNATSTRLMTVANTGRLTETSDSHIARCSSRSSSAARAARFRSARVRRLLRGVRRSVDALRFVREPHAAAVAQLHDALGHDEITLFETRDHLDRAETARANLNLALPRNALAVHLVDIRAVLNLEDGAFGYDESGALLRRDRDGQQHAGTKRAVV